MADIIRYVNQTKHAQSTDAISNYTARYFASLAEEGGPFLKPVGDHKALIADVKSIFIPHATIIAQAAKEFNIDKYLLGVKMGTVTIFTIQLLTIIRKTIIKNGGYF